MRRLARTPENLNLLCEIRDLTRAKELLEELIERKDAQLEVADAGNWWYEVDGHWPSVDLETFCQEMDECIQDGRKHQRGVAIPEGEEG